MVQPSQNKKVFSVKNTSFVQNHDMHARYYRCSEFMREMVKTARDTFLVIFSSPGYLKTSQQIHLTDQLLLLFVVAALFFEHVRSREVV